MKVIIVYLTLYFDLPYYYLDCKTVYSAMYGPKNHSVWLGLVLKPLSVQLRIFIAKKSKTKANFTLSLLFLEYIDALGQTVYYYLPIT